MHGILNINKPSGPTSHDVVAKVRRLVHEKRVGHAGTLDPLATGVLVVAIGKATRILEYIVTNEKEYQAELTLGRTTSTEDSAGEELSSTDASHITQELVAEVIPTFTGAIKQIPPMVSAIKHNGKRLYELARKDIEVERQPRDVTIHELEITKFMPGEHPVVGLRVVCSSGTYIRTLCADIGAALGVGGYMQSLVRTRVGAFELENAIDLETLEKLAQEGQVEESLISMDQGLTELTEITVEPADAALVANGVSIPIASDEAEGALVKIKSDAGALLAVGKVHCNGSRMIKPVKVFWEAAQ